MSIDIAVIPVAGHGTRLLPATKSQPKEMLPVGRKPVVQYVVEELARSGMERLLFITGSRKTAIENHFDEDGELNTFLRYSGKEDELAELDFEHRDVKYFYTRQRRQLGLGHAISCARPFVGDRPFVVALGDSIIGGKAGSDIVRRMLAVQEESRADVVIAFEEVPHAEVSKYGIARPKHQADEVFELESVVEKPDPETAPSNLAVAARYVFRPVIFKALVETPPGKGGEIQLTDAIEKVLEQGGKGIGVRLAPGEHRYDIGNFDSYFRAFVEFALADPTCGQHFEAYLKTRLKIE